MYASTNGKYTIFVDYDDNPLNPRYLDNVGTMVCWHRRLALGDREYYEAPSEFFLSLYEEIFGEEIEDWHEASRKLSETPGFIIMPLYLLDHSMLSMQTEPFNDPWDSGQVGYVYCTPEKVKREFGSVDEAAVEKARKCIKEEVDLYDHYLRDECYRYSLYEGVNFVESVGGFFGFYDQAVREMKGYLSEETEELLDQLEDIDDQDPDSYLLDKIREGVIKCPA